MLAHTYCGLPDSVFIPIMYERVPLTHVGKMTQMTGMVPIMIWMTSSFKIPHRTEVCGREEEGRRQVRNMKCTGFSKSQEAADNVPCLHAKQGDVRQLTAF